MDSGWGVRAKVCNINLDLKLHQIQQLTGHKSMRAIHISALVALFALQGCLDDGPGQQCLSSFKVDLKDPESGKVLSFEDPELTYTATNSYGARIQGKALCVKVGDKWQRDHGSEFLKITKRNRDTLLASSACLNGNKTVAECAGNSFALKNRKSDGSVDLDALHKESIEALGF